MIRGCWGGGFRDLLYCFFFFCLYCRIFSQKIGNTLLLACYLGGVWAASDGFGGNRDNVY